MSTELTIWRSEIEAELATAEQVLADATKALLVARTARDAANAEQHRVAGVLNDFAGDRGTGSHLFGTPRSGLPHALAARQDPLRRATHLAEGALSFAKQSVTNAQRVVDDKREALTLLEHALEPAETDGATE